MTDVDKTIFGCMIASFCIVLFAPLIASLIDYTYENIEHRSLLEIFFMSGHFLIQCCGLLFLIFIVDLPFAIDQCGIIPHCRKFCNRNQERYILAYDGKDEWRTLLCILYKHPNYQLWHVQENNVCILYQTMTLSINKWLLYLCATFCNPYCVMFPLII